MAHEAGIRTALFLNFGFPGETRGEMESTIRLAVRLNPTYASFHLIIPFPGTRLAKQIGIDPEAFPPHLYPQYNYVHHEYKTLKNMLRKAYLKFYLRPSYLIRFRDRELRPKFRQGKLFFRLLAG